MNRFFAAVIVLAFFGAALAAGQAPRGGGADGGPAAAEGAAAPDGGGVDATPRAPGLPLSHPVLSAEKAQRCEACHTEDGWIPARFDHQKTAFALRGAHDGVLCDRCHGGDYARTLPTTCAGCHRDPHAQVLGQQCSGCHREETWRSQMDITAHMLTAFPLTGRHGALPCAECHGDRRDRGFRQPAVACATCHQPDYVRAGLLSLDHVRSRLSTSCRQCHQPSRFTPALFEQHETCFPISRGEHRGVTCKACHRTPAGSVADKGCEQRDLTCASCHTHRCDVTDQQHEAVDGYECESLKCASCHRPR